jgi:hypothetical protein
VAVAADVQNAFQLVTPKRTYTFFTKAADQKAAWLRVLPQTIEKLVAADPSLVCARRPSALRLSMCT